MSDTCTARSYDRGVVDGDELRAVMARFPSGVVVVTIDLHGQRVGLTVASLVSLSLEPPLVGVAIRKDAALNELLREAGQFAVSVLADGQDGLAQHFARGVPPIALWENVSLRDVDGPPQLEGAAGWLRCRTTDVHETGDHTFFVGRGRERRARPGRAPARLPPPGLRDPLIDGVVFDLDGVLLDSEQVWDGVREELARERGGRWHDQAQRDMMGMSSPEWSRYMHEVVGLSETPQEISAEVVRRLEELLPGAAPRAPRRARGSRAACRPLAAGACILVEP